MTASRPRRAGARTREHRAGTRVRGIFRPRDALADVARRQTRHWQTARSTRVPSDATTCGGTGVTDQQTSARNRDCEKRLRAHRSAAHVGRRATRAWCGEKQTRELDVREHAIAAARPLLGELWCAHTRAPSRDSLSWSYSLELGRADGSAARCRPRGFARGDGGATTSSTSGAQIPRLRVPARCRRERPRARRSGCARGLARARARVRCEAWRPRIRIFLCRREQKVCSELSERTREQGVGEHASAPAQPSSASWCAYALAPSRDSRSWDLPPT